MKKAASWQVVNLMTKQGLGFGNATTYMNIPGNILVSLYLMKTNNVSMCMKC